MIFSAVIESVSAADLIYKELPSFDLRWDEYKGRQGVALVSGTNTTEGREVAALECPVEEEKKVQTSITSSLEMHQPKGKSSKLLSKKEKRTKSILDPLMNQKAECESQVSQTRG